MLQGLRPPLHLPHCRRYKEMQETTSGEFFGVGIEISMENGQVTVVTPIEDTPAFRAGLQSGDVILSINGQATQELSLQEVVSAFAGPKARKWSSPSCTATPRPRRPSISCATPSPSSASNPRNWTRVTTGCALPASPNAPQKSSTTRSKRGKESKAQGA